jgi:stress response protein SCP2
MTAGAGRFGEPKRALHARAAEGKGVGIMSDKATKFVKARCKRTGQYFGLFAEQFGSAWKITNMIQMTDEQGKLTASQLDLTSFTSNENLLACLTCGSRTVGGCRCAATRSCRKGMKYQLACLYCSELEIDNELPVPDDMNGIREGETIHLEQGQELPLRFADKRPLSHVVIRTGWDPVISGRNMDVDSSVVVVGDSGRELVCFYMLEHPNGCVVHHGDNLTGDGSGDDETIDVYLDSVPHDRDRIYFVLNVFSGQSLKDVSNLVIQICDPRTNSVLASFQAPKGRRGDTAMILGLVRRSGRGWTFKAMGQSLDADVDQLCSCCTDYT